jgi:hypothetical protein
MTWKKNQTNSKMEAREEECCDIAQLGKNDCEQVCARATLKFSTDATQGQDDDEKATALNHNPHIRQHVKPTRTHRLGRRRRA